MVFFKLTLNTLLQRFINQSTIFYIILAAIRLAKHENNYSRGW